MMNISNIKCIDIHIHKFRMKKVKFNLYDQKIKKIQNKKKMEKLKLNLFEDRKCKYRIKTVDGVFPKRIL